MDFGSNKDQLLKEHAAAVNVKVQDARVFFGVAVKCIFARVLRDMRPPWLEHSFPRALPENGALSM